MTLNEWVKREGAGAISRLTRESGLAYTTVFDAVHELRAIRYSTAKRLSSCTSGDVSAEEICDPPKRGKRRSA